MDLETILQDLGCKKPFRKKQRRHADGADDLTAAGSRAYEKLVHLLYDLGELLPESVDGNKAVETLDNILNEI